MGQRTMELVDFMVKEKHGYACSWGGGVAVTGR